MAIYINGEYFNKVPSNTEEGYGYRGKVAVTSNDVLGAGQQASRWVNNLTGGRIETDILNGVLVIDSAGLLQAVSPDDIPKASIIKQVTGDATKFTFDTGFDFITGSYSLSLGSESEGEQIDFGASKDTLEQHIKDQLAKYYPTGFEGAALQVSFDNAEEPQSDTEAAGRYVTQRQMEQYLANSIKGTLPIKVELTGITESDGVTISTEDSGGETPVESPDKASIWNINTGSKLSTVTTRTDLMFTELLKIWNENNLTIGSAVSIAFTNPDTQATERTYIAEIKAYEANGGLGGTGRFIVSLDKWASLGTPYDIFKTGLINLDNGIQQDAVPYDIREFILDNNVRYSFIDPSIYFTTPAEFVKNTFEGHLVETFLPVEDNTSILWGNGNDLYVYNKATKSYTPTSHYDIDEKANSFTEVIDIAIQRDDDGNVWAMDAGVKVPVLRKLFIEIDSHNPTYALITGHFVLINNPITNDFDKIDIKGTIRVTDDDFDIRQVVVAVASDGNVIGDFKWSYTTANQPGWVVASGQLSSLFSPEVEAVFGANLPDLITDNRFIRGSGQPGTTQTDTTAINGLNISMNSAGSHSHSMYISGSGSTGYQMSGGSNFGSITQRSNTMASTGSHSHSLTVNGDNETRPKNISMIPLVYVGV